MSSNPECLSQQANNMIVRCAAKTCLNRSLENPLVEFFPFPNNVTFSRIWATNAGREDIISKSPTVLKNYTLCAEHFEDKYFKSKEKTLFKDNVNPIPTIFDSVQICNRRDANIFSMDNLINSFEDEVNAVNNTSDNINVTHNDIYYSTEFGRLTYTDDFLEEFDLNPGVLSLKTDISDRLIIKDYCRLCAKQFSLAALVPIYERNVYGFGDMLELCLPGKFKKNDNYPHNICSICVTNLENCYKILKSFIAADNNIRKMFAIKETAACINKKINSKNYAQGVEDILNSYEDKSLIMISPDLKNDSLLPQLKPDKEIKVLSNNNESAESTIQTDNKATLSNEKLEICEIGINKISEQEKPEIKFQCLKCLKLFNNKKELTDHSFLIHSNKESSQNDFRVVKVKLMKKKNDMEINGNIMQNTKENTENSLRNINSVEDERKTYIMKYRCVKCSKLFRNMKEFRVHSFNKHQTRNENEIEYKIVEVKKKLINYNNKSFEDSSSTTYECLLCSSNHRSKNALLKHTRLYHPNLPTGKFLCRILKPRKYRSHNVICLRCSESFESVKKYRKHMKKHALFTCKECGMTFDKIYKLKKHGMGHKEPKVYNCIGCDKKFESKDELNNHEEIHQQPKEEVSCPKCKKHFTSAFSLRKHERIHKSFLCNICGKLFFSQTYLAIHLKLHSDERPFKCNICNKCFKTNYSLKNHKECHESGKKYICQVCGKQLGSKGTLKQHMTLHSPVKKHICDICDSRFHRKGNLVKHKQIHRFIRDELICKICDKVLANHSLYRFHMMKHKTGGAKPYCCKICRKKFGTNAQMIVHLRMHSGERPFKCDFCENSFRSKPSLDQHRLIHLEVYPHECDFCDRKFRRQQSLIVHRKTHTGERPFPCPICGRAFANRCDMIKHKKIHARKGELIKELHFNDADYMNVVDEVTSA